MTDKRRLEAVELPVKRKRSRSTIAFPYCDLASSERLARQVLDGGGECRPEQLAAWLGHSTLNSGAYRNKVVAAGLFGLIDTVRNRVSITGLGRRILEASSRRQARVEAFLGVALYMAIFEKHRGTRMSPMILLEQEMAAEGVTRTQVRFARQVFMRSAEQAGFFEVSESKMVLPKASHFPLGESDEPAPQAVKTSEPESGYPKLIAAILQEAPWGEAWSADEFEEWAELFVRAARVHFGSRKPG